MARNRKRAKERRARRPEPVATRRAEREDPPVPIGHAAPDVELAEAQLALGRQELADEDVEAVEDAEAVEDVEAAEPEPAESDVAADGDAAELEEVDSEDVDDLGSEAIEPEPLADTNIPGVTGARPRVESGAEMGLTVGDAAAAPAVRRQPPGTRVVHFLQGSWRELQRVQWPDRRQVMQATAVVIGFVIVAGLYLGLADLVSSKLMNFILK